jgi:hypothetical protein
MADQRPAIRLQQGKPFLYFIGNRAGYAYLAEVFAKLSRAPADSHALHSKEALAAGEAVRAVTVPGRGQGIGECIIDDALSHEGSLPTERALWWRDRRALAACALAVALLIVMLGVLARGAVAIWHDVR